LTQVCVNWIHYAASVTEKALALLKRPDYEYFHRLVRETNNSEFNMKFVLLEKIVDVFEQSDDQKSILETELAFINSVYFTWYLL